MFMYRNAHTDIKYISHISCMDKSGALWMIIDELGILKLQKKVFTYLLVLLPSAQGRPKSAVDCFISLPLNLQALAASILSKKSEDLLFYPSLVTKWWFFFLLKLFFLAQENLCAWFKRLLIFSILPNLYFRLERDVQKWRDESCQALLKGSVMTTF